MQVPKTCTACGHPLVQAQVNGRGLGTLFWVSTLALTDVCDASQDQQHHPEGDSMSNTLNDVERAEMMLSLNMGEEGQPLTEEERAQLEQFVNDNKPEEGVTVGQVDGNVGAQSVPQATPETGGDIQSLIQAEIARAIGGLGQAAAQAAVPSFEQVLKQIDPRDSDSALAMLDWLVENGRLQNIGTINGGGYLWHYSEPKGSSKQGYTPGATKGGRMVDQAVEQAKASGAKPRKLGMCDKCWSAVEQHEDGSISLDGDPSATTCANGGSHTFKS